MSKIYNEVVIDMNPESPTFEETLYEDSFEYEGDMVLMQGIEDGTKVMIREMKNDKLVYVQYKWGNGAWIDTGQWSQVYSGSLPEYSSKEAATADERYKKSGSYGLESLKKSDFFEADGKTQKSPSSIASLIINHKPMPDGYEGGATQYYKDTLAKVQDMLPKLQEVSEEEKGFAREGFKKDVYGISKDASKAGAQMRGAYGSGMGSQMRGAIAGQKDVAQQYSFAEQEYDQDIYGLEQEAEAGFESDVSNFLSNFKKGGRVPSKKTFLDVLSKLPDAKGS